MTNLDIHEVANLRASTENDELQEDSQSPKIFSNASFASLNQTQQNKELREVQLIFVYCGAEERRGRGEGRGRGGDGECV